MGEVRTVEDVHALIDGLTLLGTGGGGRPEQGLESLLPHVQAGRSVAWVSPEAIPDDSWVCSTFGMGSIAPSKSLSAAERRALGYPEEWTVASPMVRAVQELAAYTGKRIAAILPFELGAGNTATPMDAVMGRSRRPRRACTERTASAIRCATAFVPSDPVPGRRTAISSPPYRKTRSPSRHAVPIRELISASRRSPARCPKASLTALKWSRSTTMSPNGRPSVDASAAVRPSHSRNEP